MFVKIEGRRHNIFFRIISAFIILTFSFGLVIPPHVAQAQTIPTLLNLPTPGTMVGMSMQFQPAMVRGLQLYPDNPLKFDFIIDRGDTDFDDEEFREESTKLIKYFLASLTVPEDQMWVNLSPYESNKIIPSVFGQTEMGRDLLAQDYMLKQLSSSLMYPEEDLGDEFWTRVKQKAMDKFGSIDIPMNTFNKIWIVPERALIYEHERGAFILDSHLKVLLEEDYVALEANQNSNNHGLGDKGMDDVEIMSGLSSQIVREVLIPEIEREVNNGETFAALRQIYNAVILSSWYKKNLQKSLLGQVYIDQGRLEGIAQDDPEVNKQIYDQYVEAFTKGVYNYIREDYDPSVGEMIPRKYFSGGGDFTDGFLEKAMEFEKDRDLVGNLVANIKADVVTTDLDGIGVDELYELENDMRILKRDGNSEVEFSKLTRAGMAFIFGTGNNGQAVDENGEIYTADGALVELGHNMIRRANGQWDFTGRESQGGKPELAQGEKSFEQLFSGANLAQQFTERRGADRIARQYISNLPEGIELSTDLVTIVQVPLENMDEQEIALRAQSIDLLLRAISEAVKDNDSSAINFVTDMGNQIGQALSSMFSIYSNESWVENFIMVSGVGENFARVDGKVGNEDIFVKAIRDGVRAGLGNAGVSQSRADTIANGVNRSGISWEREILAAQSNEGLSIGFSVGGTKAGVGLVNSDGDISNNDEIKWKAAGVDNTEDFINNVMMELVKRTLDKVENIQDVKKIGVAFAGPVNRETGLVGTDFVPPNLPFFGRNFELGNRLKEAYISYVQEKYGETVDVTIDIYNDGAAAVLGEATPRGGLAVQTGTPRGDVNAETDLTVLTPQESSEVYNFRDGLVQEMTFRGVASEDIPRIEQALGLLFEKQMDQKRKTGEVYVYHPMQVARNMVVDLGRTEGYMIIAAILHDVVEDSNVTLEQIQEMFGSDVARILRGVTNEETDPSAFDGMSPQEKAIEKIRVYQEHVLEAVEDVDTFMVKILDLETNALSLSNLSSNPSLQSRLANKYLALVKVFAQKAQDLGLEGIVERYTAAIPEIEGYAQNWEHYEAFNASENEQDNSILTDIQKTFVNDIPMQNMLLERLDSLYEQRDSSNTVEAARAQLELQEFQIGLETGIESNIDRLQSIIEGEDQSSPDVTTVSRARANFELRLWQSALEEVQGNQEGQVQRQGEQDFGRLTAIQEGEMVVVYDQTTGEQISQIEIEELGKVAIEVSSNDKNVVITNEQGQEIAYDVDTGNLSKGSLIARDLSGKLVGVFEFISPTVTNAKTFLGNNSDLLMSKRAAGNAQVFTPAMGNIQEVVFEDNVAIGLVIDAAEEQDFGRMTNSSDTLGGIDMNPNMIDMQVQKNGNGVIIPVMTEAISNYQNLKGFVPVIINVAPIHNMPFLLGLNEVGDTDKVSSL